MLRKSIGDMYKFVDYTWNPIKGKCIHNCSYCYMKRFPQPLLHLDEKELKTDLGQDNKIFVGSSTDMFAKDVPDKWITQVLDYCNKFDNTYYFQSKNPERMACFDGYFPEKSVFGTTIETNYITLIKEHSNAPLSRTQIKQFKRRFITIEPIMEFDLNYFVEDIKFIKPDFVNIGADSKNHNLPEPTYKEVIELKKELEKFTIVNLKDNLKRLLTCEG
jgi:protein gp37